MASSGSSDTSSPRSEDCDQPIDLITTKNTNTNFQYPIHNVYHDIASNDSSSDSSLTPPQSDINIDFDIAHSIDYERIDLKKIPSTHFDDSHSHFDSSQSHFDGSHSHFDSSQHHFDSSQPHFDDSHTTELENLEKANNSTVNISHKSLKENIEYKLDNELLKRQVLAHRAKIKKQPLLKLLEGLNLDINAYYHQDKSHKYNRSNPSPRGRKGTLSSHLSLDNKNSLQVNLNSASTSPNSNPSTNIIDENLNLETTSFIETNNIQKEDTLLWCHQQINSVLENEVGGVYFHRTLLADSFNTHGCSEYRNADRIDPPTELDEILCLLSCLGKIFITEVLSLAQSVEQSEQLTKRENTILDLISPTGPPLKKFKHNLADDKKVKNISKSTLPLRILLPRHIYEAIKKVKYLEY